VQQESRGTISKCETLLRHLEPTGRQFGGA
jgi:hypothetical protein